MVATKAQLLKVINVGFIVIQATVFSALLVLMAMNLMISSYVVISVVIMTAAFLLFFVIGRFKKELIKTTNESFAPIQAIEVWAEKCINENVKSKLTS